MKKIQDQKSDKITFTVCMQDFRHIAAIVKRRNKNCTHYLKVMHNYFILHFRQEAHKVTKLPS